MDRLLTFAGHRDPFVTGPDGSVVRDGPVLDLLQQRSFDSLAILSTPGAAQNAVRLREEVGKRHPALKIEVVDLELPDPTDYVAIMVRLVGFVNRNVSGWVDENLYVSVASGTPQMHAAWVLLVTSGQLTARVLHTRPPRFVTPEKPAVEEVDFTRPAFPDVRSRVQPRTVPNPPENLQAALEAVGLVGDSPALNVAIQRVAQVAMAPVPILITGAVVARGPGSTPPVPKKPNPLV